MALVEPGPTMTTKVLACGDPDVVRLHSAYLERYGLGPRNPDYGADRLWVGIESDGRVVAVLSEMQHPGGVLEVGDCYCEPTEAGWTAVILAVRRYREMIQSGAITALRHTVLWSNRRFLKFILEESMDDPHAVIFEHRRHEGG